MERVFTLILYLVLFLSPVTMYFVGRTVALHEYKSHCEVVGNTQGQRWLECAL